MLTQSHNSPDLAKSKRDNPHIFRSELSVPQVLWWVPGALHTSGGSKPCARLATPGRLKHGARAEWGI